MARPKKQTDRDRLLEAFVKSACEQGCPPDQIENFWNAQVILQPKQLRFAALARECDRPDGPKMILSGGGRGSAKSHAILAQIFCDDCQRVPGLKFLFLRKVGGANKEQVSDFVRKLLPQLKHKYRESAPAKVEFENGSFVLLGNFKDERDIDKYLGLEYDGIYIMESNQLTQKKKINILSCLRTNKANWRPRCYQDTNPGGLDHFANKLIFVDPWKAGKETETRYLHSTVDDNAFVDKGYKEYLEKLQGWQRDAWLYGSWDFLTGAYFTNFREDWHVFPNQNVNFVTSNARRFFGSFDYGFGHRSAFILFAQDHQENIYALAEYTAAELVPSDHAERIKDLLRQHHLEPCDLDSIVAGHDCFHRKEEGNTIAQTYQQNGLDFLPAENARVNGWQRILDGFGDLNTGTKPTLFISRNCPHLIAQIKMAQNSEKIAGDVQKFDYSNASVEGFDDTNQEGDDCLDAFRYGVFSNSDFGALKNVSAIHLGDFQPAMISLPGVMP